MSDGDFRFDYMIASRDPGLSLSIMQLVKDLKTFAKAVQNKIEELGKRPFSQPGPNFSRKNHPGDHPERNTEAGKEDILLGDGEIDRHRTILEYQDLTAVRFPEFFEDSLDRFYHIE